MFAVLAVVAVSLQALMSSQMVCTWDERGILAMARHFIETGRADPVTGGAPGSHIPVGLIVPLSYGAPLLLVHTLRAARMVPAVTLALSAVILALGMARASSKRLAFWFLAVYWLAPFALYNGSQVWEPSLLLLPAAAHFTACQLSRERARFSASLLLLWSLVAGYQIHGSFLVLVVSAAILAVRKQIAVDWRGAAAGIAIGSITLWPAITGAQPNLHHALLPNGQYYGWGLVHGYPLAKALMYWIVMPSSAMTRQLTANVFYTGDAPVSPMWRGALHGVTSAVLVLAAISIIAVVAASWWYFRQPRPVAGTDGHQWLRSYASAVFAGWMICAAMTPVGLSPWHALVAFPAAAIPVAAWLGDKWRQGRPAHRAGIVAFFAVRVAVVVLVAMGCRWGAV